MHYFDPDSEHMNALLHMNTYPEHLKLIAHNKTFSDLFIYYDIKSDIHHDIYKHYYLLISVIIIIIMLHGNN